MNLRRMLAAALVVTGLLAVPASATPSVDHVSGVTGKFSFNGPDRATYNVAVTARVSELGVSLGKATVQVVITKCGSFLCGKPTTYLAQLAPSQVSVAADLSSGRLSTAIFGRLLVLDWQDPQSQALPAYGTSSSGRTWVRVYRITTVHGMVAGRPCQSEDAVVLREVLVDPEPVTGAAALPRKAPTALAPLLRATCASTEEIDV